MQNAEVVVYAPSQNLALATTLMNLETSLVEAARQNISQAGTGFTQAELHAMERIEALHLITGMDLAAMQLRYKLIREIRDNGLFAADPRGYQTLEQMAQDQGISISELSNIMDMNETIFPYLTDHLGVDVPQIWESINKSNWRELVPVMKALITGQPSGSPAVNATVENFLNDVAATNAASDVTMDDDRMRATAVDQLLQAGQLPNRRLRERLRPEPTPSVAVTYVRATDGNIYLVAQLSEDQKTMFDRRLHGYIEPTEFNAPQDRRTRIAEAMRYPGMSGLIHQVE